MPPKNIRGAESAPAWKVPRGYVTPKHWHSPDTWFPAFKAADIEPTKEHIAKLVAAVKHAQDFARDQGMPSTADWEKTFKVLAGRLRSVSDGTEEGAWYYLNKMQRRTYPLTMPAEMLLKMLAATAENLALNPPSAVQERKSTRALANELCWHIEKLWTKWGKTGDCHVRSEETPGPRSGAVFLVSVAEAAGAGDPAWKISAPKR